MDWGANQQQNGDNGWWLDGPNGEESATILIEDNGLEGNMIVKWTDCADNKERLLSLQQNKGGTSGIDITSKQRWRNDCNKCVLQT